MPYLGQIPATRLTTSSDIADDAVNSDQIAAGAVDLAHLSPTGIIVRNKVISTSSQTTSTSSTFADCTNMTMTYTQAAAGNYLYVTAVSSFLKYSANGTTQRRPWVRIVRYDGSSDVEIGVQSFNDITDNAGSGNIYHASSCVLGAYHSTGNTTEYTYKVQIKTQSGVSANEGCMWNYWVSGSANALMRITEFTP
jgi:hypothetical protein